MPSTDIDYHHRLSLQITNKENTASLNAKQIAKQMLRESISRRVGADITNIVKKKEQRRDECLVLLKPKKQDETTSLSCSPRQRLLEIKNGLKKPVSNPPLEAVKACSSVDKFLPPLMKKEEGSKVKICRKIESEKFDLRLKKKMQQEELFVKKLGNKKSTPLTNQLANVNTKAKFISFKKEMGRHASPSSSTATLPQKQVPSNSITQLPSCQSRSYNTHKLSVQDNVSTIQYNHSNGNVVTAAATAVSFSGYFDYISSILGHTGIDKNTPISITHWYSPSHPLRPSIFGHVEKLLHPTAAGEQKLIFDLVDELLVEILKPYISFKPWAAPTTSYYLHRMRGSELIGKLCRKIWSFPASDCRVLEDIDGLIEGDMRGVTRTIETVSFEEEAEELVTAIEADVVDTLVSEVAVMMWHVGRRGSV